MENEQKILSVSEVVKRYGFKSEKAVYLKVHRRQIPHRHYGSRVIFLADELDQFFENLPGHGVDEVVNP